jgi:hypothetical protein
MPEANYSTRRATAADTAVLRGVIAASARGLSIGYYEAEEVEAALCGAFGVDSQLVDDGTYFVAAADGDIVGCGGWSRRRTLFGGDAFSVRDSIRSDSESDEVRGEARRAALSYFIDFTCSTN